MLTNFVLVVENFRLMPVSIAAKIEEFEEETEIHLKDIIISNFFSKKKREAKKRLTHKAELVGESSDKDTGITLQ